MTIPEFETWLYQEHHWNHFFLTTFRNELRAKLEELQQGGIDAYMQRRGSPEICQCAEPIAELPDSGRCHTCGLILAY